MKEKYFEEQQRAENEIYDAEYQEYIGAQLQDTQSEYGSEDCGCSECECGWYTGETSQHETETANDAWWNSLTDSDKQELYDDRVTSEKEAIDNTFNGLL